MLFHDNFLQTLSAYCKYTRRWQEVTLYCLNECVLSIIHSTYLFKKVDSFRNQTVIVFTLNHNGTKHTNVQKFCDYFVFLREYIFA